MQQKLGGSTLLTANIFDIGSLAQPGNDYSVLDISDNSGNFTNGGGGQNPFTTIIDAGVITPNSKNRNNAWFRLYDASSSFLVGPQGPTGLQGSTGLPGPTGLQGPTGADSTVTGPQGLPENKDQLVQTAR